MAELLVPASALQDPSRRRYNEHIPQIIAGQFHHDSKSAPGLSPFNCTSAFPISLSDTSITTQNLHQAFLLSPVPFISLALFFQSTQDIQLVALSIMADYDKYPGTSSSSGHDHNIPLLLGIENYSICATRMRVSLNGLQALLALIDADPPRVAAENFSAANFKLMGQALSLMTSKMGDAAIDLATGANMFKAIS